MGEFQYFGISLANGIVALGESGLTFLIARRTLPPAESAAWDAAAGGLMSLMFVGYAVLNALVFVWIAYRQRGYVFRRPERPGIDQRETPSHGEEPHVRSSLGGPEPWSTPPRRERPAARATLALHPLAWAYQELSLPVTAEPKAVKKAFRRLALRYHPDRNPSSTAAARFRTIKAAYDAIVSEHAS